MPAPPDGPRRHRMRTRGSEFHNKTACRDDHKAPHGGFGGPQHAQHGAVEGLRNPRQRGVACKPQHGEKCRNYTLGPSALYKCTDANTDRDFLPTVSQFEESSGNALCRIAPDFETLIWTLGEMTRVG